MAKVCIINVSVGRWHPSGQVRLVASLQKQGYTDGLILHTEQYPDQSPTHQELPYAFKPYAFKEAYEMGYDIIIWMDSAVWANKPIKPIIDKIESDGYFFPLNGWTTGNWTNDAMLDYFGITRDEAMNIPHMMACVMGLDMRKELAQSFLGRWMDSIPTFDGAWSNDNKECSQDERCLGHRHDQSAASIIATELGMKFTPTPTWLTYAPDKDTDCILFSQGM